MKYVLPERYTRWRDAWAVHAWSHPSWDSKLILTSDLSEQQSIAEGYLGDGEPRELLKFRLIPLPKSEVADPKNMREFDG